MNGTVCNYLAVGGISLDITVTFEFDLPNGTNLNAAKTYENLRRKCIESVSHRQFSWICVISPNAKRIFRKKRKIGKQLFHPFYVCLFICEFFLMFQHTFEKKNNAFICLDF